MGVNNYGVGGTTSDGKLEILVKFLSSDSNLPRENTRLKTIMVGEDNEIGKELKN